MSTRAVSTPGSQGSSSLLFVPITALAVWGVQNVARRTVSPGAYSAWRFGLSFLFVLGIAAAVSRVPNATCPANFRYFAAAEKCIGPEHALLDPTRWVWLKDLITLTAIVVGRDGNARTAPGSLHLGDRGRRLAGRHVRCSRRPGSPGRPSDPTADRRTPPRSEPATSIRGRTMPAVTSSIRLSVRQARRLSIQGQRLSGPRPGSVEDVVRDLWMVQMDPTSAVARTEHLVLFSRLGRRFRLAELERLLWQDHALFEYHAHILPTSDLAIHRQEMRRYPGDRYERHRYVRSWLEANTEFRRYVLHELRRRGPLRTRDLENRAADGWATGGWNDDGNDVSMMLELLWRKGEVMIAGRDGQQRLWDLAERRLPTGGPRVSQTAATREILDRQLRARGVATIKEFGWAFDGRPPGWERALRDLVREDVAVPAEVTGRERGVVRARRRRRTTLPPPHRSALAVRRPRSGSRPDRRRCSTCSCASRSTFRKRSGAGATS